MRALFDSVIRRFGVVILLFLFWLAFTRSLDPATVAAGILLSVLIKYISDYLFQDIYHFYVDFHFILGFFVYFFHLIRAIFQSSLQVIPVVFNKRDDPIIFNVHLSTKDPLVVTLVANAITLTPGTITLEVGQGNTLSVLALQDDGMGGKLMAQKILTDFQHPFHRSVYRGESS